MTNIARSFFRYDQLLIILHYSLRIPYFCPKGHATAMKTKLRTIFLMILITAFCACKTSKNAVPARVAKGTPQEVAEAFFKYLGDLRFEEARQLATEQTIKTINFVETLSKLGGGGSIILHDNKSEFIGCIINNKEAICTYKTFSGGEQKVYLLKQQGRWKVDMRKDASEKK